MYVLQSVISLLAVNRFQFLKDMMIRLEQTNPVIARGRLPQGFAERSLERRLTFMRDFVGAQRYNAKIDLVQLLSPWFAKIDSITSKTNRKGAHCFWFSLSIVLVSCMVDTRGHLFC